MFGRRKETVEVVGTRPAPALAETGSQLLLRAAALRSDDENIAVEERSVWRPDSWLMQNCWETLADAGSAPEALAIAQLASPRQPVAIQEALYRLARNSAGKPNLLRVIEHTLGEQSDILLANTFDDEISTNLDLSKPYTFDRDALPHLPHQLLYCGATAAHIGNNGLALGYLERLDQTDRAWERIVAAPDMRSVLAETLVRIGPSPLVLALIDQSLRRFGDGGAELLLRISEQIDPAISVDDHDNKQARLLRHCVDCFRYGMLTTLQSQRIATAVFARAGKWDEVIQQVTTISNIQDARRAGGMTLRTGDQNVLRQVKRPQADADIDFQVYTLREAVRAMPLRYIPRDRRIMLAQHLAQLGMKSDGWTAAGAASSLAELGALKFATDVVGHIAPTDATRSEGIIALVRGLLAVGDTKGAEEQVARGLAWARAYPGRNAERALIWGLTEAYLEFGQPVGALKLLDEWREETGFLDRMRKSIRPTLTDDELRLKRLRLQALLLLDPQSPELLKQEEELILTLREWGPRLLEGETLVDLYADGLLRPLLTAGRTRDAWALLPEIKAALISSTGEKHTSRLRQISALLSRQVRLANATANRPDEEFEETCAIFANFVADIWAEDANRGLWQIVHGINGALPLVLALDGAGAVAAIAKTAAENGTEWG